MSKQVVELDSDHPGFQDQEYRHRRNEIARLAQEHEWGTPPPLVSYTEAEHQTWATVYEKLTKLYPTHACREFNQVFAELDYDPEHVPQQRHVSAFLQEKTGFMMQPVAGLVSPREFLGALAERTFCSTQYIRHHSRPYYTPEPDICHELMGHAPMLAIAEFADLSQKIGEGSRYADDDQIVQLATLYWFTVEYGVVREDGELKAYGAGLLSSFGELEHALTPGKVEMREFDPFEAANQEYPITEYQPVLYTVESIGEAFEKMDEFVHSLK